MVDVRRADRIKVNDLLFQRGIYVFEPSNSITNEGVGVIRRTDNGFVCFDGRGNKAEFADNSFEKVVNEGDVLSSDGRGNFRVILSKFANQNTLLLTDECDNRCSFCSQPPKSSGHYFETAISAVLAYEGSGTIGLTGGEPTLFWDEFVKFSTILARQDRFSYHLLSHGRNFADPSRVAALIDNQFATKTLFGIPVHGPRDYLHDQVTGQIGSFAQTMEGLQNLAYAGANLELRIIVTQQILPYLVETIEMLWSHFRWAKPIIVVMQLEPIGWANRYYDSLFVDAKELSTTFLGLDSFARRSACRLALYNFPLCHLPETLHSVACQSISDWKNQFFEGCVECVLRENCSGFFASAKGSRRPSIFPKFDL